MSFQNSALSTQFWKLISLAWVCVFTLRRNSNYCIIRNQLVTYGSNVHRATSHADVFSAVADPTRRAILDRLRKGPAPVNDLASGFRVSRPAISRHLRVLRNARLVRERRDGRQRIYHLEPERIQEVAKWVDEYRRFWKLNIESLKRHLEQSPEG